MNDDILISKDNVLYTKTGTPKVLAYLIKAVAGHSLRKKFNGKIGAIFKISTGGEKDLAAKLRDVRQQRKSAIDPTLIQLVTGEWDTDEANKTLKARGIMQDTECIILTFQVLPDMPEVKQNA